MYKRQLFGLTHENLEDLTNKNFARHTDVFEDYTCEIVPAADEKGSPTLIDVYKRQFFNLPELMNLFKEVADIKTADQLNLPTPEVEYHNIVAQPTEHQQEMVKALSERASPVSYTHLVHHRGAGNSGQPDQPAGAAADRRYRLKSS